jgi:hypothetical protein
VTSTIEAWCAKLVGAAQNRAGDFLELARRREARGADALQPAGSPLVAWIRCEIRDAPR